MKAKRLTQILGTGLVLIATLAGCAQQSSSQAEYIGLDAAKAIALDDAGVSESVALFSTTGLDRRNNVDYYAVDFTADGQEYEYDIDAVTGVVIERELSKSDDPVQQASTDQKQNAETGKQETTQGTTQETAKQPEATNDATTSSATTLIDDKTSQTASNNGAAASGSTGTTGSGTTITENQAKEIALADAGFTADQVTFLKSKLDYDDGHQCYEIEFYTSDYKEYDYEIDVTTGKILSYDYDAEGFTPPASGTTTITAEQAKEIALAKVPGATVNDIYEFEVDRDDGRLEYEGSIYYDGTEYEFTIDGYSGTIREWEAEAGRH